MLRDDCGAFSAAYFAGNPTPNGVSMLEAPLARPEVARPEVTRPEAGRHPAVELAQAPGVSSPADA